MLLGLYHNASLQVKFVPLSCSGGTTGQHPVNWTALLEHGTMAQAQEEDADARKAENCRRDLWPRPGKSPTSFPGT